MGGQGRGVFWRHPRSVSQTKKQSTGRSEQQGEGRNGLKAAAREARRLRKQLKPPRTPPGGAGMSLFCFFRALVVSQLHHWKGRRKQTVAITDLPPKSPQGSSPVDTIEAPRAQLCSSVLQKDTKGRNFLLLHPNKSFMS